MNGLKLSDLFHQCCVCHLPKAPAHIDREAITHGYHRECFRNFYKDTGDFEADEIEDMIQNGKDWIE